MFEVTAMSGLASFEEPHILSAVEIVALQGVAELMEADSEQASALRAFHGVPPSA